MKAGKKQIKDILNGVYLDYYGELLSDTVLERMVTALKEEFFINLIPTKENK